ncbi:MAG: glucosyl-3-phosphoglycerate synthase [Nocardioidaceae bacterium]
MRQDVQDWFDSSTLTGQQFDRHHLVSVKAGTSVSVVLPARDEAATVGTIVAALRRELQEEVPLLDEIVVIDSGSVDDTAEVARRAGARVVRQSDVLSHLGDRPGKGDALWKSLQATTGDVVAFIDADLREFDPQFAVGLLGPLLTDPGTHFVKAFYDRALQSGHTVLPAGGGRVTELVARPLLNLHWPVLAGVVQPLAGEYAGRRSLLERLPFVSGYGVDIALLIDVVEAIGLTGIVQVDLGSRQHRNSSDAALGRMGAQVYLALLSRLQRHGRALMTVEPSMTMTQFVRDEGSFVPEVTDVGVTERPPMLDVEEYLRRYLIRHP